MEHFSDTPNASITKPVQRRRKRPVKRPKTSDVVPEVVISEPLALGVCMFSRLPLELLAEILMYTASPRDVLAVARTSKYFCDTLLSSSSTFIWRTARQQCVPLPVPEPISTFTESSYAAALFDPGLCEVRIMTWLRVFQPLIAVVRYARNQNRCIGRLD